MTRARHVLAGLLAAALGHWVAEERLEQVIGLIDRFVTIVGKPR